jgi:putative transposase
MESNPVIPRRKSIRLKEYDYSQAGGYFVTIVTQGRECLFGEIVDGEMVLNEAGRMVNAAWEALTGRFPNTELGLHQLMPNHFHGTIFIVGATLVVARLVVSLDRAGTRPAPTLGAMVGAFKSITTHEYILGVKQSGWPPFGGKLWRRNYYEHILRDQPDYERIANYIAINPAKWDGDEENPACLRQRANQ